MTERAIEEKLEVLPVDLKKEVLDFIDFLLIKYKKKNKKRKFKFDWEGGLAEVLPNHPPNQI